MRKLRSIYVLGLLFAALSGGVAFGQEVDWVRRAGGTDRDDAGDIAVDGAGNSYVTGSFRGTAIFGAGEANQTVLTGAGDYEAFLAKYNNAGALVWAKHANNNARLAAIAVDGAGNSYVTGTLFGTATFGAGEVNQTILVAGFHDLFVAKYNSDGALVWAKWAGGIGDDESYGIAVDGAGNSYVTGLSGYSDSETVLTIFGRGEINQTILVSSNFLAKYDSAGFLVWAAGVAGNHSAAVAVDGAGNSYVTGEFEGTATFGRGQSNQTTLTSQDNVVFVAKYNSSGTFVWAKQAGTYAWPSEIAADESGNSYVTGGFGGTGFFRGTAPFGAGEPNETILTTAGNGDMFVARYDTTGALVWARRAGGSDSDGASSIAIDATGNGYVSGTLRGTATFGEGELNRTVLTSAGDSDVFVARYRVAEDSGPITSSVAIAPDPVRASEIIRLSARIDDSTHGGSFIASAGFEIRDGSGKVIHSGMGDSYTCPFPDDLCPRDEFGNPEAAPAFNAIMEDVSVSIPAFTLAAGIYNACVRGTDSKSNTGQFQCGSFTILAAPSLQPSITSVNPRSVLSLNGNQVLTINGVGFQAGVGLKVRVFGGGVTPQLVPVTFLSSLQLTIQVNFGFGLATANWTAQVINPDGQSSNVFHFSVSSKPTTSSFALPQFAFGGGWHTALHFSNTTGSVLTIQVSFITENGTPLNVPLVGIGMVTSRTISLNPNTTTVLETANQVDLVTGWVDATLPAGAIGYGVFRQSLQGRSDQAAIVPMTPVASQIADLIYDDTGPLATAAAFLNPTSQQVPLTVIGYAEDGKQIGSAQLLLGARSKQAHILRNLPGLASLEGKRGWATFSVASGALSVLGLRFGEGSFASIPVIHRSGATPPAITATLPQLAFGGGWHSTLYFSNTTLRGVSFQVNFFANKGTLLNVPLLGTSRTINLNPGATGFLEAPNAGPLVTGWVEATLPAGVIAYAVLRQSVQDRADQEAVVPLTPESSPSAGLIYDNTGILTTAAAFLNPGNQAVLLTIGAYDEDGAQIALTQLPLQPRTKRAEILHNLPALGDMAAKRGRIIFSAPDAAISVLAIQFAKESFTSIPVVADGPGW